eukprot:scaffold412_cov388-Prasinococcus_capsulatus_cf.AAC.44
MNPRGHDRGRGTLRMSPAAAAPRTTGARKSRPARAAPVGRRPRRALRCAARGWRIASHPLRRWPPSQGRGRSGGARMERSTASSCGAERRAGTSAPRATSRAGQSVRAPARRRQQHKRRRSARGHHHLGRS